jgi:hypothetical protein
MPGSTPGIVRGVVKFSASTDSAIGKNAATLTAKVTAR